MPYNIGKYGDLYYFNQKDEKFIIVGGIVCFILLILFFFIISDWHGPIVEKSLKLLAQMFFRHFSVAKIKYLQFNLRYILTPSEYGR